MNTMDDRELQELFAAKRTIEANRRRQEELRRMIEAQAAPKSRSLWPVWAGAAAACIAVLLITLPALFGSESEKPAVVAEAEVPEVVIQHKTTPEAPTSPSTKQKATKKAETIVTMKKIETIEEIETMDNTEPIESVEPIHSIETIQPSAPSPRVMRRTSTLLACTEGCTIPEGTKEKADRNIEFNFFANNYTDATIYSFEKKQ